LDISRKQALTSNDAVLILTVVILPIHIWSILHVLEEMPAWLIRLNLWDVAGLISYTQVFALVESLLLFIPPVLLGLLIRRGWLGGYFTELTISIVIVVSLWAIAVQENFGTARNFNLAQELLWGGLFLLSFAVVIFFVYRLPRYHAAVRSLVGRITPLAIFYLGIDLVCLVVLLIRNV